MGFFRTSDGFFVIMTVVILVIVSWFYGRTPVEKRYLPLRICMIVLTAGAIGNFIDRLTRGYVVDFFYFSLIDFPIFNVADIYVTVTFIVLVLLIFFYYKDEDFSILFAQTGAETCRLKNFRVKKMQGENRQISHREVPELSRSYIQKLIKEKNVKVNSTVIKSNYKVAKGDQIQITIPDLTEPDILPENIPLDILYEDDDILVVNKPKGMVVHPAAGHYTGTLVNAIMYHCKDRLSGINGVMRPGIVHRIDMDTTGSLLVCKNDTAHQILAEQLKEHSIKRIYHAIVHGNIKEDSGTVNAPIGRHPIDRKKMSINEKNGRNAVTHYRPGAVWRLYLYCL